MHPLLRFTLDLFEPNQPVAPVDQAQATSKKVAEKKPQTVPPDGAPRGPSVLTTAPALLAEPNTPTVLETQLASFRHPRASRELRLGHALIAYEFKRGQRRSIGFSVGPDGLAVRAPKWVPLYEVDAALQAKAQWILRKLQETRERHERLAAQVIDWRDGASLPFLGQTLTIRLDPGHTLGRAATERVALLGGDGMPATGAASASVLRVSLSHSASPDQIRDMVQAWLMRQARQIFQERLNHFAPVLGVQWKKLALSNAGTRWGSARSDGSIRLNWRLMHCSMAVLDYVVVHELSHLRVMDHSPRFWDTVRSVVPDYAALRQQLKAEAVPR